MKKALLIGASGFLGSHVLQELRQQGFKVWAWEHNTPIPEQEGVTIIRGTLKRIEVALLEQLMPDIIFHCARPTIPRFKRMGRRLAARMAEKQNQVLLHQLSQCSHKPILVFASGSLMYGPGQNHMESQALNPMSFARQYHKGEKPFINALAQETYPIRLLRFPWLLGPGSWFEWFYLKNIRESAHFPIFGDGHEPMQIMDIKDAAKLMIAYANADIKDTIYNMLPPTTLSKEEFAQKVAGIFSAKPTTWKKIFTSGLEKEALEAYSVSCTMKTKYEDLLKKHHFIDIDQSLQEIKKEL